MALAKLIAFDRRLTDVAPANRPPRAYSDVEIAALKQDAFRQGEDAARAFADRQLVELRTDLQRLQDGLFPNLASLEQALLAELRSSLPALTLDIARRLLAGFEPPPDVIERICREVLDQLYPERENLEIIVSEHDADVITRLDPDWLHRYPGLKIRKDAALAPGDCQVRSRFGLTDARLSTKVQSLSLGLTGS